MKKLSPEICIKIRDARRAARISQSILAEEVGCKQPALSMFEQGDGTKLSDETVGKLAAKFGISLEPEKQVVAADLAPEPVQIVFAPGSGFCPNPRCPTNRLYKVEGIDRFNPDRSLADPVGGKFCAMCGEILERKCPNCGAQVHEGGFCSLCGNPYVAIRT